MESNPFCNRAVIMSAFIQPAQMFIELSPLCKSLSILNTYIGKSAKQFGINNSLNRIIRLFRIECSSIIFLFDGLIFAFDIIVGDNSNRFLRDSVIRAIMKLVHISVFIKSLKGNILLGESAFIAR